MSSVSDDRETLKIGQNRNRQPPQGQDCRNQRRGDSGQQRLSRQALCELENTEPIYVGSYLAGRLDERQRSRPID